MVVDIQNQRDFRNIEVNKVGVKNIKYPIIVLDKKNKSQHTIAKINMYVNLPHHFKGTHMSRFIEILNKHRNGISLKNITEVLLKMKEKLHAKSAHLEIEFPYFIEKIAPISKSKSLTEYLCKYWCSHNNEPDLCVGIEVPVTTLCPCSKEISLRGAHNQRSKVLVSLRFKKFFWIEDIIHLIENSASSQVYSLLKRQDEKYITEAAYDNPMFVEDVVRNIAKKLQKDPNITWFCVESENLESIHDHNAYAMVEINPDSKD